MRVNGNHVRYDGSEGTKAYGCNDWLVLEDGSIGHIFANGFVYWVPMEMLTDDFFERIWMHLHLKSWFDDMSQESFRVVFNFAKLLR